MHAKFLPATCAIFCLAVVLISGCGGTKKPTEPLTQNQTTLIEHYQVLREALAADDFERAGRESRLGYSDLATAVQGDQDPEVQQVLKSIETMGKANSLENARAVFKGMSLTVLGWTRGRDGWFAFSCPLSENAFWVQSTEEPSNPYLGATLSKTATPLK